MTEIIYGTICGQCKEWNTPTEIIESLQRFKNGLIHVRGECRHCRAFLGYVLLPASYTVKNILHKAYRREPLGNILAGVIFYDDIAEKIY